MFGDYLGSCENHCFLSQTGEATFWTTFRKTWASFYFTIWSHWLAAGEAEASTQAASLKI